MGVTSGPVAPATIRDLSKGRGADLVLDVVGVDSTVALGTLHVTLEKAADAYDAMRAGQLDGCAVIVH